MPRPRLPASPFRYYNSSPKVIRLVVVMYVRFPLSLRNANVHNHFNLERHLVDRQTYKTRRSTALAEWQTVMG